MKRRDEKAGAEKRRELISREHSLSVHQSVHKTVKQNIKQETSVCVRVEYLSLLLHPGSALIIHTHTHTHTHWAKGSELPSVKVPAQTFTAK